MVQKHQTTCILTENNIMVTALPRECLKALSLAMLFCDNPKVYYRSKKRANQIIKQANRIYRKYGRGVNYELRYNNG